MQDDAELVDTLQQSKITSEAVTQQLVEAELTEKKIDLARSVLLSPVFCSCCVFNVLIRS